MSQFFPYDFDLRFAAAVLPFGVRPSRDGVTLSDDGRLIATYGFSRVETPLSNVDGAHITAGYRWWTAVGVRLSLRDDGLTFGTNARAGVCVHFHEKVGGVGFRKHSALTVTVADLEGLTRALGQAGLSATAGPTTRAAN